MIFNRILCVAVQVLQKFAEPMDDLDHQVTCQNTEWPISSVPSFIRYKIFYTKTILVIMVFRDCNSNIRNEFKRFFESNT